VSAVLWITVALPHQHLPLLLLLLLLLQAGVCILREAGGEVLDPSGAPWDVMSRRVPALSKTTA
jgi:hypothetical protein